MPTDPGPEPVEWGISFGRFGSDSSRDDPAGSTDSSGSKTAGRGSFGRSGTSSSGDGSAGSSGSSGSKKTGRGSFGRSGFPQSRSSAGRTAGGQKRARSGGRGGGSRRAPFDDPFSPVVGSSADAPDAGERSANFGFHPEWPDGAGHDAAGSGRAQEVHLDPSAEELPGRRRAGRSTRGRAAGRAPGTDGASPPGSDAPARSDEDWASEARSILLRQLALGARSRHQLDVKLTERAVPATVAAAVLDRFEEVQLIDDAEFARMWVRTRTAARSLSRSSLRRELADKGIETELAEDALLQISDEDEHERARDVVRRKLRSSTDLSDRAVRDKEVRRLVGVLARKGYSPGTAFSIVKDVIAEAGTDD